MNTLTEPFDLSFLADLQRIAELVVDRLGTRVEQVYKVGEGFYALVYLVELDRGPGQAIVKCHKYQGRGLAEGQQLHVLREHATVRVPEVYALHPGSATFPCEALTMEVIPGINASQVVFPDERCRARFVDQAVEALKAWHAVHNTAGFGELDGPYHDSWVDSFRERIAPYRTHVRGPAHRVVISAPVMHTIDRSFEALDAILSGASTRASLVHSDYNAWNMIVDPETYALSGAIDPIDAGWSDPEIDLFHLANCRPELGMLERYLEGVDVDVSFWLRYRFYRFWDDVKHYCRMGWYGEERFRGYADALEESMDECLA
jgi:aminoglycoside phosphotransferase (APT) family kinase protein